MERERGRSAALQAHRDHPSFENGGAFTGTPHLKQYRSALRAVFGAAASALALGACATPASGEPAAPATIRPTTSVIGRSLEQRAIDLWAFGSGPEVVLMIATIHGNEAAGTPLLESLAAHLRRHPELLEGRQVLIVPNANPDGRVRGSRGNARGIDVNRNFPAQNFREGGQHGGGPLSEPESRALHSLISDRRPARIISIHQPLTCIDFDGPADALAEALSRVSELPLKRLGSRAGSLGSYAGVDLGIPVVTIELPRDASRLEPSPLWERYAPLVLEAITYTPPAQPGPGESR